MIYPTYFTKDNVSKSYLGGKRFHYIQKEKVLVLVSYKYTLSAGEDMYSLAAKVFGEQYQYLWTIIAEINELRMPTDWEHGEIVNLPQVIVIENNVIPLDILPTNGKSFTAVL